ncbi:MAG: TIGR01777 family protein, partial [Chitinophagaceae bacterium]
MSSSVLVTGGTGFIGELLIKELLLRGHSVVLLTRRPHTARTMFNNGVKYISDIADLPTSYAIDIIINLAGARIIGWRWTKARKKVLLDSRIKTTDSIVNWIANAEKKPEIFFSASAIGYYGIQAESDPTYFNEESQPQSIFMSTLCQEWETAAKKAAKFGVTVNIMRFGLVLGHKGALPMMLLPIKLGLGGALGSGKQSISWIHVDDLL